MHLVRKERTGEVHAQKGSVIRSRGRYLVGAECEAIVAGVPFQGPLTRITCPTCRAKVGGDPEGVRL